MSIQIRHQKNKRRGTELTYATIPIDEAREISEQELKSQFEDVFPNLNYTDLAHQIGRFSSDKRKTRMVYNVRTKEVGYPTGFSAHNLTLRKNKKQVSIIPTPVINDVTAYEGKKDTFERVLGILQKGFTAPKYTQDNSFVKKNPHHRFTGFAHPSNAGITRGDSYSVELYPEDDNGNHGYGGLFKNFNYGGVHEGRYDAYSLKKAGPTRILSVNVKLAKSSSEEERQEKMKFYQEQITNKYHIPVRFFEGNRSTTQPYKRSYPLETRVLSIITIFGLGAAVFFLSSNLTGNAIADLTTKTTSFIGAGLLIVGLVAGFFWVRSRKKK